MATSDELTIRLHAPGMTPLLRAGLGGLAASLRAIAHEDEPNQSWPRPVRLAGGEAVVEKDRITIRASSGFEATLTDLFSRSFRIKEGIIFVPGSYPTGHPWDIALAAALQNGYKRTLLQHGQSAKKAEGSRTVEVDVDETKHRITLQPFISYVHQKRYKEICKAVSGKRIKLAGWASPGAVEKHIAYEETSWEYDAPAAMCGFFSLVGCLSYEVPDSGGCGVLVVPEPYNLVRFAALRPLLTARRVSDAYVAGTSDAVLNVNMLLKMEDHATLGAGSSIRTLSAVNFRVMPWAPQQKNRSATLALESVPEHVLLVYEKAIRTLPNRVCQRNPKKSGVAGEVTKDDSNSFFVSKSSLRAFVAENLASGKKWYADFATASDENDRRIHKFRESEGNGALWNWEKEGLVQMTATLDEVERQFIESIHIALKQRFGAIADECKELASATMNNRFDKERDRWRFAFAGAKTSEQVRASLADLWSRAGTNRVLQEHWTSVLPLLRAENWQAARDLALVALASYRGQSATATSIKKDVVE